MSIITDLISSSKERCVLVKLKTLIMSILAILLMVSMTSLESHAAKEYKIAQTTTSKAKIYKSPSKKSKHTTVTKNDLTRSFYVRESRKADKTTYYRLEKGDTSIGWVDAKVLKITNRTLIDKKKRTLYVMKPGFASTMPATTASNKSYDLDKRRGYSMIVERYEKIGNHYWYKGKISGRAKVRWVRADYLTTNPYVGVDLRKASNVKATDLQKFMLANYKTKDNILYKLAPEFIKAQKSTGVSAQFMFAHAILETGWGDSTIAQHKNNLFGFQAYDTCPITCSKYFPTGEDGLKRYGAHIVNRYLVKSGPYYHGMNVLDMNVRYATDKTWGLKIANLMNRIKPYEASYYAKVKSSTKKVVTPKDYGSEIPSNKLIPSAFVNLPSRITGKVTASSAIVYSIPFEHASRLGSYKKGATLKIQAYHSDVKDFKNKSGGKSRWYRISISGKQGWIRSDQVKMNNLAFTTSEVNLRENAGTKYKKVSSAVNNTPLELVKKSNKFVTKKDSSKNTWYQAYNPKSSKKTIWIRSDLIKFYN